MFGNETGSGDVWSESPAVVEEGTPSEANLHLKPTDSVARDAGITIPSSLFGDPPRDWDGDRRPQYVAWDIGADEVKGAEPGTCSESLDQCHDDLGTCNDGLDLCLTELEECQSLPVLIDADGDGRPDAGDRCPKHAGGRADGHRRLLGRAVLRRLRWDDLRRTRALQEGRLGQRRAADEAARGRLHGRQGGQRARRRSLRAGVRLIAGRCFARQRTIRNGVLPTTKALTLDWSSVLRFAPGAAMHERSVASSSTAARFVRSIVAALAMLSIPGFAGPAFAVTFTVDSTADVEDAAPGDGICATAAAECTLRAALAEVFFFTGGTTVGGEIDLPAGNYVLDPPVSYQSYSSVALHGAGAATTTITGLSLVQLLMQASVLIEKVTLVTGGVFTTQGGAGATLRFVDAVVASPDVQSKNNTFVIFEGSTLTDVDLYADDTSTVRLTDSAATGGKIQGGVKGRFFLVNSSFTDGDGATIPLGSRLECTDSVISGHSGAGVDVASSGTLVGTRCEISDNDGAGLEMTIGSTTQVTFADGLIAGNRGGGVNCNGGNHGIWTITNSTIDGNTKTGNGAGLFVSGDLVALTLINVTITNNVATGAGGGIFIESFTNGSDCSAAETTISGVLLAGNGEHRGPGTGLPHRVQRSPSRRQQLDRRPDRLHRHGRYRIEPGRGSDGGPAAGQRRADLGAARVARGQSCDQCGGACALSADQRGVLRPQSAACDIGAFEYACGNGTVDLGETCDGGNAVDGGLLLGQLHLRAERRRLSARHERLYRRRLRRRRHLRPSRQYGAVQRRQRLHHRRQVQRRDVRRRDSGRL